MAQLQILAGHPDFLDLPWSTPLAQWESPRMVELPTGVHRHVVRFVAYDAGAYAIKELPVRLARHEYSSLQQLQAMEAPAVEPVGVVARPDVDPDLEGSGAVITRYLDYGFSYREVIAGESFAARRNRLLDAFAHLLVELHLVGCFWGDCSLSNVLYRWDADAIEVRLVDAETVRIHDELSPGQRAEDIDIMRTNVIWGMADIAASRGREPTAAELGLGDDIARRYESLWNELHAELIVAPDRRYQIQDRIRRINDLGYEVAALDLTARDDGTAQVQMKVTVGGRRYHSRRLFELTRVEASEEQARQILDDLRYHMLHRGAARHQQLAAVTWRVESFEPTVARIAAADPHADPIQGYVDFLHHRYLLAAERGRDVDTEEAFRHWEKAGRPARG